MEETIAAGAALLFSAGNNHELAGGRPEHCHPSTIFGHKLRRDVFTVGACDLEGELWDYSSRGPAAVVGSPPKPDLVAPVPRNWPGRLGRRGSAASPRLGNQRRLPAGGGSGGADLVP